MKFNETFQFISDKTVGSVYMQARLKLKKNRLSRLVADKTDLMCY